jgi:hypothetical protein
MSASEKLESYCEIRQKSRKIYLKIAKTFESVRMWKIKKNLGQSREKITP